MPSFVQQKRLQGLFVLRLILTSRWSAPAFHLRHPNGWATLSSATSSSDSFEYEYCLLDPLQDIHAIIIAR
jgi:hypothetical protein